MCIKPYYYLNKPEPALDIPALVCRKHQLREKPKEKKTKDKQKR